MRPARSNALTGSRVGALGTAGEMSTPAIAIRTASATSPEMWLSRKERNAVPTCNVFYETRCRLLWLR